MPCAAPARGKRNGGADSHPPFNDAIDNDPCGKPIVASLAGVDVSAQSLCLPHLAMKLGQREIKSPVTFGA